MLLQVTQTLDLLDGLSQDGCSLEDLCVGDNQWWHKADHIALAGCDDQEAHVTGDVHDGASGDVQLHTAEQASSAHLHHVLVATHGAAERCGGKWGRQGEVDGKVDGAG